MTTTTKPAKKNSSTLPPHELDASKVSITEPKKNKDSRINAYMLQSGNTMYVQTPRLRAPFGISGFVPKGSTTKEWSLNLSAVSDEAAKNDPENAAKVNNWFKQWEQIDDMMIDHGIQHSKTIFGKTYTPKQNEVVRALYTQLVKNRDDDKYPHRIQPKIAKKRDPNDKTKVLEDMPDIKVYNENKEELKFNSFEELEKAVPKGGYVRAILQPKVWYIAGKFGLSMTVLQLEVSERSGGRPNDYAFGDDDTNNSSESKPVKSDENYQPDSDTEQPEEEGEVEEVEEGEEVEEV